MGAKPKIVITISRNEALQEQRTRLLSRAGYSVIPLGTDASVGEFLRVQDLGVINLILMCHSVPEPSRVALSEAIKLKHPEVPILMLYNGYDPTAAKVDGRLENMKDPQALLDTLLLLLPVAGPKVPGQFDV